MMLAATAFFIILIVLTIVLVRIGKSDSDRIKRLTLTLEELDREYDRALELSDRYKQMKCDMEQ